MTSLDLARTRKSKSESNGGKLLRLNNRGRARTGRERTGRERREQLPDVLRVVVRASPGNGRKTRSGASQSREVAGGGRDEGRNGTVAGEAAAGAVARGKKGCAKSDIMKRPHPSPVLWRSPLSRRRITGGASSAVDGEPYSGVGETKSGAPFGGSADRKEYPWLRRVAFPCPCGRAASRCG